MPNILTEIRNRIGIVTVNRPEQMNCVNAETRKELVQTFEKLEKNNDISVCILTGTKSKAFIAGADIKEFSTMKLKNRKELEDDWRITSVLSEMSKPIIAMIDGFCLGGGLEIAMACDIRLASERTKLGQPEINIGIIPGAGGTQRLTNLIGEGRSMEMILGGEMISAHKAEKYGLVNSVFKSEELEEKTLELAQTIAGKSTFEIKRAKKSIKAALTMKLNQGLKYERELFIDCFKSKDGKEGIQAFIEKRKPNFKGK